MNGPEAVKTAGDRLSAIKAWSRRTCYAAAVAALCLVVMAACSTYAAWEYVRFKSAVVGSMASGTRRADQAARRNAEREARLDAEDAKALRAARR
jgi:hypothetical protein